MHVEDGCDRNRAERMKRIQEERPLRMIVATLVIAIPLAGCNTWFGGEDVPLPGERQAVMLNPSEIEIDPELQGVAIVLPPPVNNPDWPQADGYANHAMHHLEVAELPRLEWRARIGSGIRSGRPRLPPPVIGAGKVFAMDSRSQISAFAANSGDVIWRADIAPSKERHHTPGGIAYENGRVFATTGFASVVALDAETGEETWRSRVDSPVHAPPTVRDGRVFAVSLNNTLYALDAGDGRELWTYSGIPEMASVIGGASPAVDGGVIVAAFSSGELVALRVENGRVLWEDSLGSLRRTDELGSISHIRASPVIDRGRVYALSYGGMMVAVDLRNGRRLWDASIGGIERPWVAGDMVYVVTAERDLIALDRDSGRIYWATRLPTYKNEERRKGPVFWSGPVLVSDRLVVTGSSGEVLAVSPYTGELLGKIGMPSDVLVPPVVAGGTLYFLKKNADLTAYR
jgi:outer membrane protein assembly factor BamB